VPPLIPGDSTKLPSYEEIADCFGDQLNSVQEFPWVRKDIHLEVDGGEVNYALRTSPGNTAGGLDQMLYLLLRFFWKKHPSVMLKIMKDLLRMDIEDWHRSSCVLIKKGDKERYNLGKS